MDKHDMELPQYVAIGRGLEQTIAQRLSKHGYQKCVMITSKTPFRLYGSKLIEAAGRGSAFEVFFVDELLEEVEPCVQKARASDVVVGVGGGRVADVSKVVAELSGRPFFSVPTVASHDGIASPMTSYRRNGQAYSRKSVMPSEVFADMNVISLAPRRYLLSGCGDLLAKHSAVRDWWLGHRVTGEYYGRYAAHLAYLSASVVMKSARLIADGVVEGVRTVVEALISAGVAMGVAGSSRPCSGSEHLIAHALESLMEKPALHGERCGVAAVFTSYLHRSNWRKLRDSLVVMGAASKLEMINVDADLFVEAVKKAPEIRPDRYTILHRRRLCRREIVEILQETQLM
ncbi:MAG: sn-glycerol-1-phosphate dehydrogenase [Candidatus Caldarchaeum sp.]|uniref:Glycerol-1-phosphate dehydrogenase [NAD(P)+] n=1 Tax=Caldiarchaeum subterraneum TaxID=311458 RepID=A0A7C5LC08_CALS0